MEKFSSQVSGLTRLTSTRENTMWEWELPEVVARLDRIDQKVGQLIDLITKQKTIKDYYTNDEVEAITNKAEFTVREYCRLGRIKGQKRDCGRGSHPAWSVSHQELVRFQNDGLLPLRRRMIEKGSNSDVDRM